jgi:predicted Zn-dependent protease
VAILNNCDEQKSRNQPMEEEANTTTVNKGGSKMVARVPSTGAPLKIHCRIRSGRRQLLTQDIEALMKLIKPKDAYCIVAVVMEDLYPQGNWRYIVGEADMNSRVGVFSFSRFTPHFHIPTETAEPSSEPSSSSATFSWCTI